jgi:UDP-N-acetylmuramyl tripeptide synthase
MLPDDAPAVINIDDPRGLLSWKSFAGHDIRHRQSGQRLAWFSVVLAGWAAIRHPVSRGPIRVRSKLVGRPNVYNILAAVAARLPDVPVEAIERAEDLPGVPGR